MNSDDKYIVKITTNQANNIKHLFNLINLHVKEANLNFCEEGIFIRFHEELNISIKVELDNENNGFTEFICREPITIGVNVSNIANVLKNIPAKVLLTIFVERNSDPNLPEKFGFIIENPENSRITRFDIKPIDVNDEDSIELEQEYGCNIGLLPVDFANDINTLKQNGSDSIQITYYKGVLKFYSKSDKADIEIIGRNSNDNAINVNNTHINIYTKIAKLIDISKFSAISKSMTMYIQNDSIIIIEYAIANMGHIRFGIPNNNKPDGW